MATFGELSMASLSSQNAHLLWISTYISREDNQSMPPESPAKLALMSSTPSSVQ